MYSPLCYLLILAARPSKVPYDRMLDQCLFKLNHFFAWIVIIFHQRPRLRWLHLLKFLLLICHDIGLLCGIIVFHTVLDLWLNGSLSSFVNSVENRCIACFVWRWEHPMLAKCCLIFESIKALRYFQDLFIAFR